VIRSRQGGANTFCTAAAAHPFLPSIMTRQPSVERLRLSGRGQHWSSTSE
jgi:hypothetical protein